MVATLSNSADSPLCLKSSTKQEHHKNYQLMDRKATDDLASWIVHNGGLGDLFSESNSDVSTEVTIS